MDIITCNTGPTNSDSQVSNGTFNSDAELSNGGHNSDGQISCVIPVADILLGNGAVDADYQNNKSRKRSSPAWNYFTTQAVDANHTRAFCKQCNKSFSYINGSKSVGTSHLNRHIRGICPAGHQNVENQRVKRTRKPKTNASSNAPDKPRKRNNAVQLSATLYLDEGHCSQDNVTEQPKKRIKVLQNSVSSHFDEERCSRDIAKMIIQHNYPLDMVAHPGFIKFVRALQPQFKSGTVDTIEDHILRIYLREKDNVLSLLAGISGRVNVSLDSWFFCQTTCYVILTGQFIDCDWNLHRRILNAFMLPTPDSEVALKHAIAARLSDWNLDSKLFALTSSQYFSGEAVKGNLRGLLNIKNPATLNGQLIISSCYARALSGVAREALVSMEETVEKVRQNVKYVITSQVHRENFAQIRQQLQVPSMRALDVDDKTKWNTTYEMLIAACELKEVFSCLDTLDPEYRLCISVEEWRQTETLCVYLKLLHDAAGILTDETIPTANIFFHEVWKIQLELLHGAVSPDAFTSNLTRPLKENFDRYWQDSGLILAVAVVMDPRFKMKLVDFSFSRIYGQDAETWIKVIDEGLHELFVDYVVQSLPAPNFFEEVSESVPKSDISEEDGMLSASEFLDFDIYISEIMSVPQGKSELDQYLEEPLLPRVQAFDVLGWWKHNRLKYPTLSKMASDILSISFSTVLDADSVFDMSQKRTEQRWSTLRPSTVQALVCAKDWLQYETDISTPIVKT